MLFDTLALISLLIVITLLGRLVNIFPSLMACIVRGKENVNLEMSVKLSRDRNLLASAMIIPFCLASYRFGLCSPAFMDSMTENVGLCVTLGVFIAYIILRILARIFLKPHKSPATYDTAAKAAYTFFIILTLTLLAVGGTLSFLNIGNETIRDAMIWISGIIYAIFIFRKIQIFASSYNYIIVFLYLCALEIIPTGVLIASAIIL